ncbi:outer membrane lipoprotein-sorting protein [Aliiglaciecola sp. CAU 1673]|uniref:outer membrane lipoprotein-sorting protein n=1 Tax=Aliiglaciecola sp. CAU 1673 TaxID=3032595 RepID=UPI0023DBAD7B|nr:outer membrane lipoprotein-sorting protein [Aliiglaciecola sp. CAU 1673]MDF2178385.1 outer membrane lipoprotein-sorting protein [Aliiglaciecola sp. CAU 1673]
MTLTTLLKNLGAISLVFAVASTPIAQAQQSDAEKGLAIAKERKIRDEGWGDSQAEASMILRTSSGQEIERKMRLLTLEMENDGDKGLTVFDQPADVKGTAFLNYSHALEPDEQWMYLPALKRVKRIASKSKSGPFMGSEFAFEDLSSFEVEKFSYKYLRDEKINGQDAFVLEQVPAYEFSGYTKMLAWIDKEHYRAQKIEFYDRKDSLLKTLTMHDYKQYLDKYWRPMLMKMVNHQNGKSTDLVTHELTFRTGLTEEDFSQASLKRAR